MSFPKVIKSVFIGGSALAFFSVMWSSSAAPAPEEDNALASMYLPLTLAPDTPPTDDDLPFPFDDESWDPFPTNQQGGLYLSPPSNVKSGFTYNQETGTYEYTQKMGDMNYRSPVYMTFEEYSDYSMQQGLKDNWKKRIEGEKFENEKAIIPQININSETFDRLFGGNTVDIKPQGTAELIFAVQSNKMENPAIPVKQRRQTAFDFNQKIQLNVIGNIGEKLKISTNYNTEATFDFENQMKLEYTGYEDDIIKKIEAGNVNLPLTGSLITGSQSLFGIKTQMQFGKLWVTSVFSQQKGKKQEIEITGGVQTNRFELKADNYEANRHYFLAQYFRDQYNRAMESIPYVNSTINITKMEVWVTNNNSMATSNTRNIVAFQDLGEKDYYNQNGFIQAGQNINVPDDSVNTLYGNIVSNPSVRNFATADGYLNSVGLSNGTDFEVLEQARLLSSSEYTFHPQLGFVSLNQTLNPDQVLGVAFQFTVGGSNEVYQVGEFSTDINEQALVVKLLKSTTVNTKLPMWDLMMKNVYSLGAYSINEEGFHLDVLYTSIAQGTDINYLPEGQNLEGRPLLQVVGLDRLNGQKEAKPDGRFDFVNGLTINQNNGRLYFPVVEPFGDHLRAEFGPSEQVIANKYVFDPLYDTTKIAAQQVPSLNRFKIKGYYRSNSSSDISLNAMNIPEGSVTVTAGGNVLTENVDYRVDYTLGRVQIINQGLLQSNTPIKVSLESNALFAIQSKSLFATHLDYQINKDFTIGGTIMNLTERPLTPKVNIGDEPMSNTVWGLDGNYRTESRFITRMVDKLPFLSTKETSTLNINGEFAHLIPGNSKAISKEGIAYIDDFEGSQTTIDIRNQGAWTLASVPQGQPDMFPEAALSNDITAGYNRARFAWYQIDPLFWRNNNITPEHIKNSEQQLNHYTRQVQEVEVFPNRSVTVQQPNIATLDLAYYPLDRGQYNYDTKPSAYSAGVAQDGKLLAPDTRWGGIMRKIETTDFNASNIEYIQFWVMDPFHPDNGMDQPGAPVHSGGDLYFNLGSVSEDILRDSRKSFEHGLPEKGFDLGSDNIPYKINSNFQDTASLDTTDWGVVSKNISQIIAFSTDQSARKNQDVGLDGLKDEHELTFFQKKYIDHLIALYGNDPNTNVALREALEDPSTDNFHHYRGTDFDNAERGILWRYKFFNGMEDNSRTTQDSPEDYPTTSTTTLPNIEDINKDNTLSMSENYNQYKVSIRPQDMVVGQNYIISKTRGNGVTADNENIDVDWYQFRIPVKEADKIIGNGADFNNVRFIRMFMKGFQDSVVMRFARLEFVRGDWRKYEYDLTSPGEYISTDNTGSTVFDISSVNLEENSEKTPVNYVIPPGIERVIQYNTAQLQQLNEQAMVLKVCGLEDGDARAGYKNLSIDARSYGKLKLFVHAEQLENNPLNNGDLRVFVRLGRDYNENFYEYEIPVTITPPGSYDNELETHREAVWPLINNIEIEFDSLYAIKLRRNQSAGHQITNYNKPYEVNYGNATVRVVGNPNLSEVNNIMIGVRNPKKQQVGDTDDGFPKCAEIWVNELRLTDFIKNDGYAATGRVTAKLADFGTVAIAGNISTPGWGSIEKKISERQRETRQSYDISTNLEMGKVLPEKARLSIPLFYGFGETYIKPEFDPNDPDIKFNESIRNRPETQERDSVRQSIIDYTKRKSINFTNVRREKDPSADKHFYDVENLSVSFAINETEHRDVNIEYNNTYVHRGNIAYNYSLTPKEVSPFKNFKPINESKYLKWLADFNFYPTPSKIGFITAFDKSFNEQKIRDNSGAELLIFPTYNKNFLVTRNYTLTHDFTKSLKFDFSANNFSRILEPEGRIDTDEKKDSLIESIKSLGVNTNYNHAFNLNYNVPFSKLPGLEWLTATARYSGTYDWTRAPFSVDSLGNTIKNSNAKQVNAQANMITLYNKIPYFKKVNQKVMQKGRPQPKKPSGLVPPNSNVDADSTKKKEKDPNALSIPDHFVRVLMMVKNVSFAYSENAGTILPGFIDSTQLLGFSSGFGSPTPEFILGLQEPDFNHHAGDRGWVIKNPNLNLPYTITKGQNFSARSNIEPLKDLKIELNATRNTGFNYSEFYRWNENTGAFASESPLETGNFSISYISFNTAFQPLNDDNSTEAFEKFLVIRKEISDRLAEQRENAGLPYNPGGGAFADGYGPNSQDVMLLAFMAAYSGSSAGGVSLNPLPKIPKPNWRITYDGFGKMKFFKKYFKSFTVSHGYRSSFNVGSYTTNILFNDHDEFESFTTQKDLNGNFIPEKQMTTASISEQFSPLINIDMTWQNSLITKVEMKRDRNLALNFSDGRVLETRGNELVIGLGYRIKKVKFPFALTAGAAKVENPLNLRADISIRGNKTVNHGINDNVHQVTGGQRMVSIKTAADYVLNNRLNLRIFFDKVLTRPEISTSFPSSNTSGGFSLRFTLS